MGKGDTSTSGAAAATGLAVVLEMTSGGLFMENVKMEKQRTSEPYPAILRRTLAQGLRGFEAGLWPWGLALGLSKGTVLGGAIATFDATFSPMDWSSRSKAVATGVCSGAVQGVVMSPILLARTRVNQSMAERAAQSAGRLETTLMYEFKLSTQLMVDAVRKEGGTVLLSGMPACVVKRMFDWGTRFLFIDGLRTHLKDGKAPGEGLTDFEKFWTSLGGGAMSAALTMPFDRLLPVIQAAGASDEGLVKGMQRRFAQEGPSTFFRGGFMRVAHTSYHTCFAVFVASKITDLFSDKR